jgi:hypothetical protein
MSEGGLSLRPTIYPLGGGQMDVGLDAVDLRAEAMVKGARERLTDLESELRAFASEHLAELAAERAPLARLVAERAERALRIAGEASRAFEGERSWWARVLALTAGEGEVAAVDTPGNPFEWLSQAGPVALPMPARFLG